VAQRLNPSGRQSSASGKPKLLEQVRTFMRARRYSLRTEEAYLDWIRRFILFHGKRHPRDDLSREKLVTQEAP
jgi:hypothetical protein